MKIIDEKGMLFGKINIIDFLLITLLLCLTPTFYFGYKIFQRKAIETVEPAPINEKMIGGYADILINCKYAALNLNLFKKISIGDKEEDEKGNVLGEVLNMTEITPYEVKLDLGTNKKMSVIHPKFKQVSLTLRIRVRIIGDYVYYKNWKIRDGEMFIFSSPKYWIQLEDIQIKDGIYNAVIENAIARVKILDEKLKNADRSMSFREEVGAFREEVGALEDRLSKLEKSLEPKKKKSWFKHEQRK